MDRVIAELKRVVAEGREIFACADDQPRMQDWLARREQAFKQLADASGRLSEAERPVVVELIEAIRHLDAGIIGKFQERLNDLSAEIASTRKLKGFLGASGAAQRPAFFRCAV